MLQLSSVWMLVESHPTLVDFTSLMKKTTYSFIIESSFVEAPLFIMAIFSIHQSFSSLLRIKSYVTKRILPHASDEVLFRVTVMAFLRTFAVTFVPVIFLVTSQKGIQFLQYPFFICTPQRTLREQLTGPEKAKLSSWFLISQKREFEFQRKLVFEKTIIARRISRFPLFSRRTYAWIYKFVFPYEIEMNAFIIAILNNEDVIFVVYAKRLIDPPLLGLLRITEQQRWILPSLLTTVS